MLVTGFDLGMNTSGSFAEYIRVPAAWVVPLPEGMSLREAMIYGTAGFTAALSCYRLIGNGVLPEQGPVLVTGATGGVGSIAVALLAKSGYQVTAVTTKVNGRPPRKRSVPWRFSAPSRPMTRVADRCSSPAGPEWSIP